jgi:hypothetical protein
MDLEIGEGAGNEPDDGRPPSSRARIAVWVLAGLVVLGIGYAAFGSGSASTPTPDRTAAPPTDAGPGPTVSVDPSDGTADLSLSDLQATAACPPITDHHSTLRFSFWVTNTTPGTIHITRARAQFPIGGLHQLGPAHIAGTCAHPGNLPARFAIPPGGLVLYTIRIGVDKPRQCPTPYPVRARIDYTVNDSRGVLLFMLASDLASIRFDSCS